MLSREWGMDSGDDYWGLYQGSMPPFPTKHQGVNQRSMRPSSIYLGLSVVPM